MNILFHEKIKALILKQKCVLGLVPDLKIMHEIFVLFLLAHMVVTLDN